MSNAFAVALIAVPVLVGCNNGGGNFVGTEADPLRNEQCGLCVTDPPPVPVDCAAEEAGTEFLPLTIWDFQGIASNLYAYNDGSALHSSPIEWELPSIEEQRCLDAPPTGVFHYRAGPHLNWGGAVGRHFKCLNAAQLHPSDKLGDPDFGNRGCGQMPANPACPVTAPGADATPEVLLNWSTCPQRDKDMIAAAAVATANGTTLDSAMAGSEEYLLSMVLDLSQWDGISFWARRSSDSQAGIRVSIGDKFTDDDISYMQYHVNPDDKRACERNIDCGCVGNSECSERPIPGHPSITPHKRCWDLPPLFNLSDLDPLAGVEGSWPPLCGQHLCTADGNLGTPPRIFDALQHEDQQRLGTTCQNHRFNGGIEGLFCYEPTHPPVENSELCGDHWQYPVYLSTEWKFYKVPFKSLLQQGWAKKFDKLDVANATMIRFQWGTGWIDFWLDDVRVYRDANYTGER